MPAPTNVSLSGIIGWARTASVPAGTDPTGQDINADTVDGKHYSQLKAEWIADAQSAGGGGCVAFGDSTFVGNSSYRTITFTPDLGTMQYVVSVIPTANTSSYVGEVWWTRVSGTKFRVYNAGSGTTAFRWSVMVQGQMPDLAGAASGDVTGTHPGPYTVARLQGKPISTTAPTTTGQVLTWDGSAWAPADASGGGGDTSAITYQAAGSVLGICTSWGDVTSYRIVTSPGVAVYGLKGGWYGDGTFVKVCDENSYYTLAKVPSPDDSAASKYYPHWHLVGDYSVFGTRRTIEQDIGTNDADLVAYASPTNNPRTKILDGKRRVDFGVCIFCDPVYTRWWYLS